MELAGQVFLWNHILRFASSMSLKCALELNVADVLHLHDGPISLTHLASALSLPQEKVPALGRLMRLLTYSGIFDASSDDVGGAGDAAVKYMLNPTSLLLLRHDSTRDSGIPSVQPLAMAMLHPVCTNAWHGLATWFRDARDLPSPFDLANNNSFWGVTSADPMFNGLFNDAMTCGTQILMTAVASRPECREVFRNIRTMVDIGGGTGAASKAIAKAFPGLQCTVLELPQVVAQAVETEGVKFLEGDMFQFVPPADAIMLKWILHDWSDEECVKILKRCKEAITTNGKDGKVIIIDMILNNFNRDNLHVETQYFFDMNMMVLVPGKERSEIELSKLFKLSGYNGYKIVSLLGLWSLIEIYP